MTQNKNYGPSVSGYLTPDGRGFETVVTQAGKPLLDRELNLSQDLDGGAAQEGLRRAMPSGWLSDDFLSTSDSVGAIFAPLAVSNKLKIPGSIQAHVNGWLVPVKRTGSNTGSVASVSAFSLGVATITGLIGMAPDMVGTSLTLSGAASVGNNGTFVVASFISATSVTITNGSGVAPDANNGSINWVARAPVSDLANYVSLPAGPAGAGASRTDLVLLEVFRRLISASPSTVGKSASGRIWQQGNVATDPASDLLLNYADDILDTAVGAETTKRVQIQYRLRVITGVNIFTYPYGLEDPSVVAFSVPTNAATPNGVATVFPYVNQSSAGDPGLWVAGNGNPTNTLGTVDGYMYAIPLLAVFRRNTSAFNRVTNQNGGVASPGPSDRPDGLLSNIIAATDLVDLRQGVSPTGWSLAELLEKNVNLILDNSLRTEIGTFSGGGGNSGTTLLLEDEIGISTVNGGTSPTSGTTPGGPLVGEFDAVRRRFSDRAIVETVTVALPRPGGGTWADSDVVTIDPTALTVYPYTAFNWAAFAPADVQFLDVVSLHWSGTASNSRYQDAEPYVASITGLGSAPVVAVNITFGSIAALGLSHSEILYVTLLVGYPTGVGLSRTPVVDYSNNSFAFTTTDPALVPALTAAPVSYSAMAVQALDFPHREAHLEYGTGSLSFSYRAGAVPTNIALLPERASVVTSPAGVLSASGRVFTLSVTPVANATVTIAYTAIRPMPQPPALTPSLPAVQMAVYYRAAAPQMARASSLASPFTVVPKLVSQQMYSFTAGSGSQDESYPYATAYVQTGGVSTAPYSGESELAGSAEISVADFNAMTGMLKLPVYVPMVANPESLTFTGLNSGDVEGRSFYATVPVGYVPNAYAQDLSNPDRHKNVLPLLAELSADSVLGHRGQLVLILLVRYAIFDETNGVFFDSGPGNATSASVFRIKGLLLNKRAE